MSIISFLDKYIPDELHENYDVLNRARLIVASGLLLLIAMVVMILPSFLFSGGVKMALVNSVFALLFASVLVVMKKTGSNFISGNIIVMAGFIMVSNLILTSGGSYSLKTYSLVLVITFAYLLAGLQSGTFWSLLCFLLLGITRLAESGGFSFGSSSSESAILFSAVKVMALITVVSILFELTGSKSAKMVKRQQEKIMQQMADQSRLLENTIEVMTAFSQGDLTKQVTVDVEGDLSRLKDTVNQALRMMNDTMVKIARNSEGVLSASVEMSKASQAMAEGTSQQAASLEEISSSINEIDSVAKNNENNALQAQQLSCQAMTETNRSNEQMKAIAGFHGGNQ